MTSDIPADVLVGGAVRRMEEARERIARAIAMLPEGEAHDLRLVATMLDDALVLLDDVMGGGDEGLRDVRQEVRERPEAHRPRDVDVDVRGVLENLPPARQNTQAGGEAVTAREDIRRELEKGARLQTWLERRCARDGIDVAKVLRRMEADGEVEVVKTAYEKGRFVPVYRLKEEKE